MTKPVSQPRRRQPPLTFNAWLRYDIIRRVLNSLTDVRSVLEIGTGGGAVGVRLAQRFEYTGVEQDRQSFLRASEVVRATGRGRVIEGTLETAGPLDAFDLVCAFEVLEHIEDDVAALDSWRVHLRPGGWLLISVPAFQHRMGPWDLRVGHYRRYDPGALTAVLEKGGFEPATTVLYGFPLGYALETVRDLLARRKGEVEFDAATAESGRVLQPSGRSGWVTAAGTWPFRMLQRALPSKRLGTGLVALARRRDEGR
jgi:SAM-dependent methyltransferase